MAIEQHKVQRYELIIPEITDWPIARFYQNKEEIIEKVKAEALGRVKKRVQEGKRSLPELLDRTMYMEKIRIAQDPMRVDPKDEKKFWTYVQTRLQQLEGQHEYEAYLPLLEEIIERYLREIFSGFKPGTYHFAKRFLPFMFSSLLNASAGGNTIKSVVYHDLHLQDKVHLLGATQELRELATKGTIMLLPTHQSHVDSILIAWGLHALGLPAFIYGAGLILFNARVISYFLKRLGAYKIDRRKKNPIYLESLFSYVNYATHQGVHSIFYPGGTRSRSGKLEDHLKLGLLGTAIETQRKNLQSPPADHPGKIFIVPVVLSYHFVLEAKSLITQHLKRSAKDDPYIVRDEFSSYTKFLKFVWTSFSKSSEIAVAFGKPMDVFGNFIDKDGNSLDEKGNIIDLRKYFEVEGVIQEDKQKEVEYVKILGEKIVERFYAENRVFSSHLVAFVAFEMMLKKFEEFSLHDMMRIPVKDRVLEFEDFKKVVEKVYHGLVLLMKEGKIHMAEHMQEDLPTLIAHGVKNLGMYHAKRPLTIKKGKVYSEQINLLYFYHNHLDGYGLEAYIT